MTSPCKDFQHMDHIVVTVARRFTGFIPEGHVCNSSSEVKDYTTKEMHISNGTHIALEGVVRDIQTQQEPTLGVAVVTRPETWRKRGE